MLDLLTTVVRRLVTQPDAVRIREVRTDDLSLFEVQVAKADLGRVIGKSGRTANALRVLMVAIAALEHRKVTIEIVDRDVGVSGPS
jgi:hypothetical protein